MSELRTKLLALAIQGGATIENATKVAGDWEQWALFGGWHTDPLRLGVSPPELTTEERETLSKPSPEASCNGNCGASWCKNGCLAKEEATDTPVPTKIDWSRRQLVIAPRYDCIVETTGDHEESPTGYFTGYEIFGGKKVDYSPCFWPKHKFVYYGEIQQNQQDNQDAPSTPDPTKIDWSRPQLVVCNPEGIVIETTGSIGHDPRGETFEGYLYSPYPKSKGRISEARWFGKAPFTYYGEIPQDQKPKTTGLSFLEAISTCGNNLIGRPDDALRYGFECNGCLRMRTYADGYDRSKWSLPVLDADDLLATDWQIEAP